MTPFGARRAARHRRWPWRLFFAASYDTAPSADPTASNGRGFDEHVLDYRKLDSLRLVSGEIYADR
jgi:hypothetical protein